MTLHPEPASEDGAGVSRARWFIRGLAQVLSVPGLILMTSFIGFAGLARESGISLGEAVFITGAIWAMPAHVVLIGAILSGATVLGAALLVALSSVRLMPMVVALLPELRGPGTRRLTLLALSHFIAVTGWVLAMQHLRDIPRAMRTTWFAGVGTGLCGTAMIVVAAVYLFAAALPPAALGALFLLTPIYFLTSLWASAREVTGLYAMGAGLVLGPVFHAITPGLDLLLAGIIGGVGAWAFGKLANGKGLRG